MYYSGEIKSTGELANAIKALSHPDYTMSQGELDDHDGLEHDRYDGVYEGKKKDDKKKMVAKKPELKKKVK